MAKYRLRIAHELETKDGQQRIWLPGDVTNESLGPEKGAIVGDGTDYHVRWPTLEMIALDAEAEAAIGREEERLKLNDGVMNPIEALPLSADDYETRYIPGMEGRPRREPRPDGAPIRTPAPHPPNHGAEPAKPAPRSRAELPS
jgi:hypothetical protein